jgi:hypothetical protein
MKMGLPYKESKDVKCQGSVATFFTKNELTISNSPRIRDQQQTATTFEEEGRSSNPFSFSFSLEENEEKTTSRNVFEANGGQGLLQSKTQRRRKRRTRKKHNNIYPDPNNVTIAIQKEVTVKQDTENRADILPAEVEELGQDVNRIIPARDFTFHGSNFRLLKIEQLKIVFL